MRPGVFLDPTRARHNRDRQAKFGFSGVSSWPFKVHFNLDHPDLLPTDQFRLLSASSQNEGNDKRAVTQSMENRKPLAPNPAQSSRNTPMNSFSTSRKLAWSPAFSTLPARTTDGTALSERPNFSSPTTGRFFRTSPSSKPFQRRKNLKPSASRILSPRASSNYEFFPRQTVRNGHPLPRSGCLSGDELRLVSKK